MNHSPEPLAAPAVLQQLPMALFDQIECGLIVCDASGAIHFANQAARAELATKRLLLRSADSLRRAPGVHGDLDHALRMAANRGCRSLVRLSQGPDRLMATAMPLQLAGAEQPLVLIMLGRRRPCSELGLEMLAGSYGLTMTERRVLAGLVREASPREIAAEQSVQLSTVRTHISRLRTKLGARNIDGLLLRAAEVPPVASALCATA